MQQSPALDLLVAWKERVATCGTNLSELQQAREFARLKARAAQGRLCGQSVAVVERMVGDMSELWSLWNGLRCAVDAGEAEASRGHRADPVAIARLLTTATVDGIVTHVDAKVRGAFQAASQKEMLTLDEAAERIEALMARVQQGIAEARAGWEARTQRLSGIEAAARQLHAEAVAVDEGGAVASAEALVAAVQATSRTTDDDPVGAARALDAVQSGIDGLRARVAEVRQAASLARQGLDRAASLMLALRHDRTLYEEAHARAVPRLDACSGVGALAGTQQLDTLGEWLGRLRALPGGRISSIEAGLTAWNAAFDQAQRDQRRDREVLTGLLLSRKDLIKSFGMLDATAEDWARSAPGQAASAARAEARRLLAQRPMSLPLAAAAVAAFENEIVSTQGRGPSGSV